MVDNEGRSPTVDQAVNEWRLSGLLMMGRWFTSDGQQMDHSLDKAGAKPVNAQQPCQRFHSGAQNNE